LIPDYRRAHLNDLERIPLDHGSWRPIRRPLAITGFAVEVNLRFINMLWMMCMSCYVLVVRTSD
jgi:hypothetical protein